jgi:hypothetical protein
VGHSGSAACGYVFSKRCSRWAISVAGPRARSQPGQGASRTEECPGSPESIQLGSLLVVAVPASAVRWAVPSASAHASASIESAARDIAAVFRQPGRAAALFTSSAGLPLSFGLALWTSALAFGADVPLIRCSRCSLAGTCHCGGQSDAGQPRRRQDQRSPPD